MNKKSEVDILIEQCIQDANGEYLEEGFVDNIKAGLNGAKEWIKADARNSFKLGKKNDIKNDRKWSARKGKVASYAKSIANTMQDFKKQGGTLGRGMKVDDVISRLNQVAQGKYPRGKAQATQQTQQNQSTQPQETQTTEQPQATKPTSTSVQNQGAQKSQLVQQKTNSDSQQAAAPKPASTNINGSANSETQNKKLSPNGSNVPQETTVTPQETKNNNLSSEANELLKTFGSFISKDTKTVDKLQGIYNKLSDDEKENIKQQVNPDIINLINLQQNNAPYEQLNQAYGALSAQDRGIFRVLTGTQHSSQVSQTNNSQQVVNQRTALPPATSESKPGEQKTPKTKSPGLAQKVGKALTSGDKKLGDAVRSSYKGLNGKMVTAKDKKKVQPANLEVVEPEIVENPADNKKQPTSSTALGTVKQQMSPGGRPMKVAKGRVVDAEPVNEPLALQRPAKEAQNSNPQLALPAPASKKKLSNAEKAKRAISKAQANVKKAKANAPKLNIPSAGKPVKHRRIITAKQRKDIDAASKEMEDFHKGLGDTGAEWEETIHESFYGSNTSGQLKMLNSIR